MPWICKNCNSNNSNLNAYCARCKHKVGILIPKENETYYDDDESLRTKVILWKLEQAKLGLTEKKEKRRMDDSNLTKREKFFIDISSSERTLVSSMDDIALRAHIEELQEIAKEVKVRLIISDDEARDRSAKKKQKKGFIVNLEADEFTSNAINNINERQRKMTKVEKEIERLVGLGIAREDAENMYKASTLITIKQVGVKVVVEDKRIKDIVNSVVSIDNEEKKIIVNPFTSKIMVVEGEIEEGEIKILEAKIESINIEVEKLKNEEIRVIEKPKFINPFSPKVE